MNKIHSTVIIDGDVKLGENIEILPYSVLIGPLEIGDNNWIGPQVVIGAPGEDTKNPRHDTSDKFIRIGNNNIIREHVSIQKPCYKDITSVGDGVFLMHGCHIPHDAILQDDVVITPMCVIGGISNILKGANVGMGATVHQYSVVGHYSLVAMGSALTKNLKPFSIFVQGKPPRVNSYAIEKFNFSEYQDEIRKYVLEGQLPISEIILSIVEEFEKLHKDSKRTIYQ